MDTPVVQPVPPPPKNNSGILIGILLFLLGILVGLALGKTSIISGLRIPYLSAIPTPTPSLPATPSPTPDQTTGWKTYTGDYFSVKYPNDWNISDNTGSYLELVKIDGSFDTVTQKKYQSYYLCFSEKPQLCRLPKPLWIYT